MSLTNADDERLTDWLEAQRRERLQPCVVCGSEIDPEVEERPQHDEDCPFAGTHEQQRLEV